MIFETPGNLKAITKLLANFLIALNTFYHSPY